MKNFRKPQIDNFVTIESHFGVEQNMIRADTRNKCSEDLVAMIQEITQILYPNEKFEIYLLPPERGSYKDIIKFVKKYKIGSSVTAVVAVGGLLLGYLKYKDNHETYLHGKKMAIVDDTKKCLSLEKDLEELSEQYDIESIPSGKIKEVCGNLNLKKRKNDFYTILQNDSMVKDNETIMKDKEDQIIFSKKIEREDFSKYIAPITDQKYTQENVKGIIELISPVMKQKRAGKGMAWRGVYYGDDITINSFVILENGEYIDFYMQDQDFKKQISSGDRSFTSGDNMKVIFDITGYIKAGVNLNRNFYIKEVESYNEEDVPHKVRLDKKAESVKDNQLKLI